MASESESGPVAELNLDECWALLASNTLGRIATCAAGKVDIFPVNYYADGSSILFRTAPGTKLIEMTIDDAETAPLEPWIPTLKYRFVRITPTDVTGRAFKPAPEPERF